MNDMKDQLVSFETAKLAKEKGFKSKSRYYDGSGELVEVPNIPENDYRHSNNILWRFRFEAPTQSLLQKWLREEHNCIIEMIHFMEGHEPDNDRYWVGEVNYKHSTVMSDKYEGALEHALQIGLKLIK